MQNAYRYSHTPTQLLRIFVIVHLSSFLVSKSILDAYYDKPARQQPQQIHRKPAPKFSAAVPSYQDATDALETARTRSVQPPNHSLSHQHIVPPPPPPTTIPADDNTMAPKQKGENTKKAAGNAKKAEVAAQKAAAADRQKEADESQQWSKGAKSTDKKADQAEKKAAAAAAKAERDRLLAEEEKNQPSKPKGAGKKTAEKKVAAPKLNLDDLDRDSDSKDHARGPDARRERTLNASGIDNALDALDLTTNNHNNAQTVERHPERRFKAAYKAFEERRLPEIEAESPGLRRNQRVEQARKEFERSPENPFNQVSVGFDASREEVREVKKKVREGVEGRLADR